MQCGACSVYMQCGACSVYMQCGACGALYCTQLNFAEKNFSSYSIISIFTFLLKQTATIFHCARVQSCVIFMYGFLSVVCACVYMCACMCMCACLYSVCLHVRTCVPACTCVPICTVCTAEPCQE